MDFRSWNFREILFFGTPCTSRRLYVCTSLRPDVWKFQPNLEILPLRILYWAHWSTTRGQDCLQNLIRIRGNRTVACVKLTLSNANSEGDRVWWPRAEFVANPLFPARHQLARGNDHAAVDANTAPSPLLLQSPWLSARPRTPLLAYKLHGSAHEKVQTVSSFSEYCKMFKFITPRSGHRFLVPNHSLNHSVIWKWPFFCVLV